MVFGTSDINDKSGEEPTQLTPVQLQYNSSPTLPWPLSWS